MQGAFSPWPREGGEPLPVVLDRGGTGVAAPAELPPPDWVAETRQTYTLRITDWMTQAFTMVRSPHRFMAEWATGRREALNPFRYLAVGTGVSLLVERGSRWVMHLETTEKSWVSYIRTSIGVTITLLVFSFIMHGVLRFRSRAPLRTTAAAIIYSSAGPSVLLTTVGWVVSLAIYFLHRHHVPTYTAPQGSPYPYPVLCLSYVGYVWLVAAITGAHRIRWWWAVISIVAIPIGIAAIAILVGVAVGLVRAHV